MRRSLIIGVTLIGLLAACSAGPAPTSLPTVPPLGASGGLPTIPPLPSGLPTIPPLPSGLSSFSIPSFNLPSFNSDADLAARFPQSIAGAPLDIQTFRATDFLQFFENDPEGLAQVQAFLQGIGVSIDAVSIGIASFDYQESNQQLSAIRAAGADPARLLSSLIDFTRNDANDPTTIEVTQSTVGGKAVSVLMSPYTDTTYVYGAGDIVWTFETDDPALADQVMGAIP